MALTRLDIYPSPFRLTMQIRNKIKDVPWFDPKTSTLDPVHVQDSVIWAAQQSNVELQDEVQKYIIDLITAKYDITETSLTTRSHRAKWTMNMIPATNIKRLGGIRMYGNRFPTFRFNVDPRIVPPQKGISVANRTPINITIRRGKTRTGVPNRFLAKMPRSGHIGVYRRINGSKSLKIDEEFMKSIPELVVQNKFKFKIQAYMDKLFLKYYDKYILKAKPIAESTGATLYEIRKVIHFV